MSYIFERVSQSDFCQAFVRMDRKEQFSYEGRVALFEYLEQLAEETGEPWELDIIALCCDYSEYADITEYNKEYGTEYESWDQVENETIVIRHSHDAAIVQAH